MLPTPAALHEAFLWSERRLVAKTATVSLHGNTYEVDAALVGRRVELVFDPFDLTDLQVRYQGRHMGVAVGHQIGRHVHPGAKPETSPDPAPPTGIDYLALVRDRHTATLNAPPVNYAELTQPTTKTVGTVDIADTTTSEAAARRGVGGRARVVRHPAADQRAADGPGPGGHPRPARPPPATTPHRPATIPKEHQ